MALKVNLAAVGDREVLDNLQRLVRHERETILEILNHITEIEKRELHIREGYSSMFSYLTERCRYSEPAAARRLRAARCIREYPQALELLKAGEVNLSTISIFFGLLTKGNVQEVLDNVAGKSKAEVEAYVAQYRPKSKIKEGIKPVTITPKKSEDTPVMPLLFLGDQKSLAGDSPEIIKDTAVCTGTAAAPVVEQYEVRFLADRELIDKYREAEAILSGKYRGKAAPALVISELLECFLEKYSPARRQARRQRAAKSDNRNLEQRSPATPPAAATAAVTRSIRDAVLMRDGRRCSYVGPGGKRCNARHNLQVDHIIPRAFGGGNELGNLRCLCKTHNLFMAKELIGRSYMSKFTKTRAVAETVNDSSI